MGSGSSKAKSSSGAPAPSAKAKEKAVAKVAQPVPKPVAFEISFVEKDEDSIINKHPPKRLQRLEQSAQNTPKLTAKMLEEKLRIAEQNREKELDKVRRMTSASRVRQQLKDAQEQEGKIQDKFHEVEDKVRTGGKNQINKFKETEQKLQDKGVKATNLVKEKGNNLKKEVEDFDVFKRNKSDDNDWDWSNEKESSQIKKTIQESRDKINHISQLGTTKNNRKRNPFTDDDDFFG